MQFPESWLRQFCNPPISTDALADKLTDEELLAAPLAKAEGVAVEDGTIRQSSGWRLAGAIDPLGAAIFQAAAGHEPIGKVAQRLAPGIDIFDLAEPIRALLSEGFFSYPSDLQK
ncbi:hypothetical protein GALL_355050 [mine drainage metagenome]|uniref:Uncharacterized protein n=1 Tax=mine drainage metagenome TaxID=410659 RepID=A0A1J5QS47_9ZZZZ